MTNTINSKVYWDDRFSTTWESCQGREQSRFFAQIAIDHLPAWFKQVVASEKMTICDWGCAEADGTDVLAAFFGREKLTGVDFSEIAIQKAREFYGDLDLRVENWLSDNTEFNHYDVVFSSNTLEHFQHPYETLEKIARFAKKMVVLVLPYREFERISEHHHTFCAENLPLLVDDSFTILHANVVDCSPLSPSYWGGEQIILVYARSDWVRLSTLSLGDITLQATVDKHVAQIANLNQALTARDDRIARLTHAFEEELQQARGMLNLMEASSSWKITQPLRDLRRLVELLRTKVWRAIWLARTRGPGYLLSLVWRKIKDKILSQEVANLYRDELRNILAENHGKPIVIFHPVVDWDLPLLQRPQHVAKGLADQGFLYFFCTPNVFDTIAGFSKIHDGCYVTNQFGLVAQIEGKKIFHIYATDPKCKWEFIEGRLKAGDVILYEYIDEIHEDIAGAAITSELLERHARVLRCPDVICVASAEKLYRNVERFRTKNLVLVTNGVDVYHFTVHRDPTAIPSKISNLVGKKKPIIGYFGALAKWFDYELVISLAKARPHYEILLIGLNYDYSIDQYPIRDYPNITFIGPVDYQALPQYACWFDVSTIPFRVNEVTESTSPIKLFEYMALGRPIVTTDMPECRKYRSALVAKSHKEFLSLIDAAVQGRVNPDYSRTLQEEARKNSWVEKSRDIAAILRMNLMRCENRLLDEVQQEIVDWYRHDNPNSPGYYEQAHREAERYYWFPVLAWIDELPRVDSVLDIGTAYGTLLLYTLRKFHPSTASAVDAVGNISLNFVRHHNINYFRRDVEREDIEDFGTYDLVIFTEVLEHLNFNPMPTLRKLRRLIKPGGYFLLTTPDAVEWGRVTKYFPSLDAIPAYSGQQTTWIDDHIWQYTSYEAEAVFAEGGFVVSKFAYAPGVNTRHLCYLLQAISE